MNRSGGYFICLVTISFGLSFIHCCAMRLNLEELHDLREKYKKIDKRLILKLKCQYEVLSKYERKYNDETSLKKELENCKGRKKVWSKKLNELQVECDQLQKKLDKLSNRFKPKSKAFLHQKKKKLSTYYRKLRKDFDDVKKKLLEHGGGKSYFQLVVDIVKSEENEVFCHKVRELKKYFNKSDNTVLELEETLKRLIKKCDKHEYSIFSRKFEAALKKLDTAYKSNSCSDYLRQSVRFNKLVRQFYDYINVSTDKVTK